MRCLGCMEEYTENTGVCPYCGYSPSESGGRFLAPGTLLADRYTVGKVLGSDDVCVTYIGFDNTENIKCRITEYLPAGITSRAPGKPDVVLTVPDASGFTNGLAAFESRMVSLTRMPDLKGVALCYDVLSQYSTEYAVSQYFDGMLLSDYMEQTGAMNEDKAIGMLLPVMNSLSAAHKAGIFHGSISPADIVITDGSALKLCGFERLTAAPSPSPKDADIFALGAILYTMISSVMPQNIQERTASLNSSGTDSLAELTCLSSVSVSRACAIHNAVSLAPADRTKSIDELLEGLSGNSGVKYNGVKLKKLKTPSKKGVSNGLKVALLVLIAALLIGAVVFLAGSLKDKDEQKKEKDQDLGNEVVTSQIEETKATENELIVDEEESDVTLTTALPTEPDAGEESTQSVEITEPGATTSETNGSVPVFRDRSSATPESTVNNTGRFNSENSVG